MKHLLYIISILLAACGPTSHSTQEEVSLVNKEQTANPEKPTELKPITYKKHQGNAVLIGEEINFLNNDLQGIRTINEGEIVEITGVSDSLLQLTDDYCDAFRYVKLKSDTHQGIIDGRNVYEITESDENISFKFNERSFDLKTTAFFGIGVDDEAGLTFCTKYYEPVVLIDGEVNQPQLILVVKNDISKEASWRDHFKYMELMANDGAYDKIKAIEQAEDGIILTIKRSFQEGWNEYQVRLILTGENYKAEYLNYGEIKY